MSLKHRVSESRQLHISVHLPHKSGRLAAKRHLAQYVQDALASGIHDEVFLHGDFNIKSNDIESTFNDFSAAFNNVITTSSGSMIDNVVLPIDSTLVESLVLPEDQHNYTHFPISAEIEID